MMAQESEPVRVADRLDKDGWHDEEECRGCLKALAVINSCRRGECSLRLIIEVDLEDVERELRSRRKGRRSTYRLR